MSEEEVLQVINNVANRLAGRFKFGYHDLDDMRQQARLFALEGIDRYDEKKWKKPLENFLWTHVRNRLFNYKRDKYERPDKPCLRCPIGAYDLTCASECQEFEDKLECAPYKGWVIRNESKRNLMKPIEISSVQDSIGHENNVKYCPDFGFDFDVGEIKKVLNDYLPIEYRHDYLKLLGGIHIPKTKRLKLIEVIRNILDENRINDDK